MLTPIIPSNSSDTGAFDSVLELLVHCGRDIPEVMMMLVPEAWQNDPLMPQEKKDFYMHTSALVGGRAVGGGSGALPRTGATHLHTCLWCWLSPVSLV
jgi:hypothetical protein